MSEVIPMKKADFWEVVDQDGGIYRHKVPGGWLVKVANVFQVTREMANPKLMGATTKVTIPMNLALGVTFYPDEKHEWVIEQVVIPEKEV